MSYSSFIMGVFGLYVAYYAINIVYDSFFRKEKKPEVQEEDVVLVNDEEETPQLVDDEDDGEKEGSEESKEDEEESIVMQVEHQGIPFEELYMQGKSLFATVNL